MYDGFQGMVGIVVGEDLLLYGWMVQVVIGVQYIFVKGFQYVGKFLCIWFDYFVSGCVSVVDVDVVCFEVLCYCVFVGGYVVC